MGVLKRFWNLLPALLLWLMLSVFLWGWIFALLTDTAPENKLTLFVDADVPDAVGLAVKLEETALSDSIRMVKVHPFSYAMLDGGQLRHADLYIVREGNLPQYLDWFAPLPEGFPAEEKLFQQNGISLGIRIFNHETGSGAVTEYISYLNPQYPNEDFYLLFGNASAHLPGGEDAADGLSLPLALNLITIP